MGPIKNKNVQTIPGRSYGVKSLEVYEKDIKPFLVSGSYGTIKVWDLDSYDVIEQLSGRKWYVNVLCVFYHDGNPYLVSGSQDDTKLSIAMVQ